MKFGAPSFSALHPIVRLAVPACYVMVISATSNIFVLAGLLPVLIAFTFTLPKDSHASIFYGLKKVWEICRLFSYFLLFTFIVQLFISSDGGLSVPTFASAKTGAEIVLKFILLIAFPALFIISTSMLELIRVFYLLLRPLKLFGLSDAPRDGAFAAMIAVRFIPILRLEGGRIIDAMRLRGELPAKGARGGRLILLKSLSNIVPILFIRTFNYASNIAITLEYRRSDEAFFALQKFQTIDFCAILVCVASIGALFYISYLLG